MKEQCKTWVKQHLDEGMDLVKAMYEHPELGDQEFESMALLCEKLEQLGVPHKVYKSTGVFYGQHTTTMIFKSTKAFYVFDEVVAYMNQMLNER